VAPRWARRSGRNGNKHIVTFLIIAPYKYSYLLTYLLTRSSAIAETARVTISDSGRSAIPNCNRKYDLSPPW